MTPELRQALAELAMAWDNADRVTALKVRWPELASAIDTLVNEFKREQ